MIVELVGGKVRSEGIVELVYNNQRGKLCDTGITEDDVKVLCRMLGYEV